MYVMVKVKNLVKTLGPIILILGILFFLSQSKKVNIFRYPPDLKIDLPKRTTFITPTELIPLKYTALIPQFFGLEPTQEYLTEKFGQLYQKTVRKLPKQVASRYSSKYPSGYQTNYTPLFEYE